MLGTGSRYNRLKKRDLVLAASLILNIALAYTAFYFASQNSILASRIAELNGTISGLNKELYSLEEKYELVQSQLESYKSWAERYSNATGYEATTSGIVGRSSIYIVALREAQTGPLEASYEGVVMTAEVEIRHGEGRLLVNTQPKIGIDLQASSQTAMAVVERLTGVSFKSLDVILTIKAESEVEIVDGPSAGAAITICILAAIQNKAISRSVFITGTINPDGSIGKVGGIPYKALAAARKGVALFLVPLGQVNVTIMIPREERPAPGVTIITYELARINLQQFLSEQGYNTRVAEVRTITEAYNYFIA